jgi:hypothetical protein
MPNLTSVDKVKEYMGITDATSDTLIGNLVSEVSIYIANFCGGRNFLSQSYTEVYDTKAGRHKIFLRQIPVTAITSVKYRGGTPSNPTWLDYHVDGYLTYLKPGYIHFFSSLPGVAQGMQIVYTAGYIIDFNNYDDIMQHNLPKDITMAANEMVANYMNTRKAAGISSESTEGQSIQYNMERAMTQNVKTILNSYKLNFIAS